MEHCSQIPKGLTQRANRYDRHDTAPDVSPAALHDIDRHTIFGRCWRSTVVVATERASQTTPGVRAVPPMKPPSRYVGSNEARGEGRGQGYKGRRENRAPPRGAAAAAEKQKVISDFRNTMHGTGPNSPKIKRSSNCCETGSTNEKKATVTLRYLGGSNQDWSRFAHC